MQQETSFCKPGYAITVRYLRNKNFFVKQTLYVEQYVTKTPSQLTIKRKKK